MKDVVMTKIVRIIPLLALLACTPCLSDEAIALRNPLPQQYVVVKGDTLWDIAGKFLKNPWQWPTLWQNNRTTVANPHWIYPGDVLVLEWQQGQPQIRLTRPAVTLSPGVIVSPLAVNAIPPIQPTSINPFLIRPMLIEETELKSAPRIVAAQEERQILSPGTHIYVQNLPTNPAGEWTIYREGEAVKDPENGQVLGVEAHYLGDARLLRNDAPATLNISYAKEEIAVNDKLVAMQPALQQAYVPHAPMLAVKGQIARIHAGIQETGAGRVIIINRGSAQGLEAGHVLAIQRQGAAVNDPTVTQGPPKKLLLPNEPVGLAMVFKTFHHMAYALVMQASQPVRVEDLVVNPSAVP